MVSILWVEIRHVLITRTCTNCGLVVGTHEATSNRGYEFVDERADHVGIARVRRRQAIETVSILLRRGKPNGAVWLDVGCGVGELISQASRAGFGAVGLEPDPRACARARELHEPVQVYEGVLTPTVFPDAYASVISTMDVLEHVPVVELAEFAAIVHSKLAPGGIWVIKVPTTQGLYYKAANALGRVSQSLASGALRRLWQTEYRYPHTVYFSSRSLQRSSIRTPSRLTLRLIFRRSRCLRSSIGFVLM